MDNGRECGRAEMLIEQGSVVQKVYNSIHRINHYKGELNFCTYMLIYSLECVIYPLRNCGLVLRNKGWSR